MYRYSKIVKGDRMSSSKLNRSDRKIYASTRNYVALGEFLKEMRVKSKLTQREVSQALGYSSAQFVSNFESGLSSPPLKKLQALIDLYRMPVEKVMALILEGEREILSAALRPASSVKVRISRRA